jgi:hypothetical protein
MEWSAQGARRAEGPGARRARRAGASRRPPPAHRDLAAPAPPRGSRGPNKAPASPPCPLPAQVFWAFFLDCGLFSAWQAVMLAGAKPAYRFLPVVGLGAWLLAGGGGGGGEEQQQQAAAQQQQSGAP